jgi:hypothetical protein
LFTTGWKREAGTTSQESWDCWHFRYVHFSNCIGILWSSGLCRWKYSSLSEERSIFEGYVPDFSNLILSILDSLLTIHSTLHCGYYSSWQMIMLNVFATIFLLLLCTWPWFFKSYCTGQDKNKPSWILVIQL